MAVSYREAVLSESGLISFWEFTETSGTTAADSKGTLPGTYTGGFTLDQPGIPNGGRSVRLNGSTGWVRVVRADTSMDFGDVFSLEAWIKLNTSLTIRGIFCRGQAAGYMRFNSAGNLQLDSTNVADIVASTNTLAPDGKFHHTVITKNGATVKTYVDGIDVTGTVTNSTCGSPAEDASIGQQRAAGAGAEWFNGWIGPVSIYSVEISAAQVYDHFAAGIAPPPYSPHRMPLGV